MRFATVPGQADGVTFTIPARDDIVGKKLRIQVDEEKQAVRVSSFTVANLLLLVEPDATEPEEEDIAATDEASDKGEEEELSEAEDDGGDVGDLPAEEMELAAAPVAETEEEASSSVEEITSAAPPKKKAKVSKKPSAPLQELEYVSTVKELTLEEALVPFTGMSVVKEAPDWLQTALAEGGSKLLIGRHI
eukprot:7289348-Prymnesium_polylepis.1